MKITHLILISLLLCTSGYGQKLERFYNGKKYGFRDATGKVVVPAKYDFADDFFSEGMARVKMNWAYYAFIDETGKEVIPAKYSAHPFSEGLAAVGRDGKWGFIDKTGKEVIPLTYYSVGDFSEGLAWVKIDSDSNYGYINKTGTMVIPPKFRDFNPDNFSNGFAKAWRKGSFCILIDTTGTEIVPSKYNDVERFSDGLAKVRSNKYYGYIDQALNVVIPLKYEYLGNFSNNYASVKLGDVYGSIDKTGKFKPYTNEEMKTIWDNFLASNVKQIDQYKSKLKKSHIPEFFKVNHPYILIYSPKNKGKSESTDFVLKFSEVDLNKTDVKDLKTIIIQYDYHEGGAFYTATYGKRIKVDSYGVYLIYFDLEKNEIIGYGVVRGDSLPDKLQTDTKPFDDIKWFIDFGRIMRRL